ncbi:MAG: glycosyltransferase [Bacteroidales bacterium]|nr:glycosyltransferase [Bacteroidales bacterium]
MISIITAIYNQLDMNKIFYKYLVANTSLPFELIIVDNNSNDGSREFFENLPNTIVIKNKSNYNYPYCQNIGIKHAKYEILCFFNNDIIISKNWDKHILRILNENKEIKVLSVATNDHLESKIAARKINRKWKKIKYPLIKLFGTKTFSLKLMLRLMYGNINNFADKRFKKWAYSTIEGYSGSAIIITKDCLETIGLWDERIQAADFDLFNRVKKQSLSNKKIMAIQLALGVYFHHYQRLTVKTKYPEFVNKNQMISLEQKWKDETKFLRKDIIG